ncbi:hypothetical protein BHF71_07940 [Vulcanibacillus modesticaldus]|uniref:M23ase beta-sheet core domain-containing protein n=1 Tax=Vulcanibacillus modesticaldus TaxID=337097 RepID=A0A1D2YVC6_9BACI|nr:M23 family metallopeptidase [Vulcanibacillus modesticaldus]OEF99678.1 hypothetical protein BHF71_07940 [Vulcanibacillus modesticaldus]
MKKNPFLTVMVIPHTERGPMTLRVSVYFVRFILTFILVGLMFSSLWAYKYIYIKREKASLQLIQSDNQKIIEEYSENYLSLYQEVKKLKEQMIGLQQLEEQIRIKNGFDPSKSYFSKENQLVLSGINNKSKMTASTLTIKTTKETIESLQNTLPEKEKSLNELLQLLEERNETLLSIPSINPTVGRITSKFGYRSDPFNNNRSFHNGLDIANAFGTPIYSTADGIVTFSGRNGGYGNQIVINHGNGLETVYAHNSKNLVKKGDFVRKGQLIAYMGSTGRSTGSHLHYEVRKNGRRVNPSNYIN